MKTGLVIFISLWVSAQAQPVVNEKQNSSCCIEMTPEKSEEIHQIGEEVNEFIQDLSSKHEDLDFTLVKLNVEQHSDDEHEDKEIMLKILVNDCKNNENPLKIRERYFDHDHNDAKTPETPTEDTSNNSDSTNKDGTTEIKSGIANDKQIDETNGSDSENEGKNNNDNEPQKENSDAENRHKSDSTEEKNEIKSKKASIANDDHRNMINGKNYFSKRGGNKNDFDLDDDLDQQDGNVDKNHKFNGYYENSTLYIYAPTYYLDSSSFLDRLDNPILQHIMNVKRAKLYRKHYGLRLQNFYGNYPGRDNFYYSISQPFSSHDNSYSSDNMMNKMKKVDSNANTDVNGVEKPHGESGGKKIESNLKKNDLDVNGKIELGNRVN